MEFHKGFFESFWFVVGAIVPISDAKPSIFHGIFQVRRQPTKKSTRSMDQQAAGCRALQRMDLWKVGHKVDF